ncbi:MAG: hypothetical protein AB1499_11140 [Nitrospirota bacterium]
MVQESVTAAEKTGDTGKIIVKHIKSRTEKNGYAAIILVRQSPLTVDFLSFITNDKKIITYCSVMYITTCKDMGCFDSDEGLLGRLVVAIIEVAAVIGGAGMKQNISV